MSSMSEWAERECRIACKRENPNFDFDDKDAWDYGCSCYKSALKAYQSLMSDGHSGCSFGFTKNILIRLMNDLPLTPITEEDFVGVENRTLPSNDGTTTIQCPRMSSLFRDKRSDGTISYHDIDRSYSINIEDRSDCYSGSSSNIVDELFPIVLPYYPQTEKYKIYEQSFLVDRKHGDFDTRGVLYIITPDGKKIEVNRFETEGDDGKWRTITKEEYDDLLSRRIDKPRVKVANRLLNYMTDYNWSIPTVGESRYNELVELCAFFDNPENYKYNSFGNRVNLVENTLGELESIPELVSIANLLSVIKKSLETNTDKLSVE